MRLWDTDATEPEDFLTTGIANITLDESGDVARRLDFMGDVSSENSDID